MKKKLVIYWMSKITGKTGHGQPMQSDVCRLWSRYLNCEYPDIFHWCESVKE